MSRDEHEGATRRDQEPGRLRLGALDPRRDEARLEAMVSSVLSRSRAARRFSLAGQLRAWAAPSLAVAATLAVVAWTGAQVASTRVGGTGATTHSVWQVSSWAAGDALPDTARLLEALGGDHGQR